MTNRMSMYSLASDGFGPRGAGQQSSQVSTTTLLNAVHNIYLSGQPYRLDAGTSLVVNTWLTATQAGPTGQVGGTVDAALAARAWEHARRRAEDGCIILGSLHPSTPSVLTPFLSSLPLSIPSSLFKSLEAIQPFLRCATPNNPSTPRQVALGVTLTLNLAGNLTAANLALSQGGIDTTKGLLNIPAEQGYRAFDVFYYLLTSASTPAEREFLGLKAASSYTLLSRSGTYDPPSYLPTADDGAAADDFRAALKEIGIKGSSHRNFISTLAGLLKLGNTIDYDVDEDVLEEICEDVGGLLGMDPEILATQSTTEDRQTFIAGLYEALVDWVIRKANEAIAAQLIRIRDGDESSDGGRGAHTPTSSEDTGDTVCITVLEIPDPTLGKAVAMRGIFDDSAGINSEMKQDGVEVAATGSSVLREMQNAVAECGPDLGITTGPVHREREHALEKREAILEKMGYAIEDDDGFLKKLLFPVKGQGISLGREGRIELPSILSSSRVWYHLCVHPTDESPASLAALPSVTSAWSAGTVSRQLRAWRLPEWANRRNKNLDFTADFDVEEFVQRYAALGCKDGRDGIESWILERGWSNGEVVVGNERVWMRENAWWEAESMLDLKPMQDAQSVHMSQANLPGMGNLLVTQGGLESGYSNNGSGYFPSAVGGGMNDLTPMGSREGLLNPLHNRNQSQVTLGASPLGAASIAPSGMRNVSKGDYGLGMKGDDTRNDPYYDADGNYIGLDAELADGKKIEERPITWSRRAWVAFVWALTFWIPSPLLRYVGRMKRPDVRMAWREKVVIFFLIALMNGLIVFWIIGFGKLLCPNFDKAYSRTEIENHRGRDDFWVSIHGKVYDISKYWKQDHSDVQGLIVNDESMLPLAGFDLSQMFRPRFDQSCQGLQKDQHPGSQWVPSSYRLENNFTDEPLKGVLTYHTYGTSFPPTAYITSKLYDDNWYNDRFSKTIKEYFIGDLVWAEWFIKDWGQNQNHPWFLYKGRLYDLEDYLFTLKRMSNAQSANFLNEKLVEVIKKRQGEDLTEDIDNLIRKTTDQVENAHIQNSLFCIQNSFFKGVTDFRITPRCQVNNYLLLAFAIIICAVIGIKFLAALQFGSKRRPAPQDKFVICQVPAYTEGEDSLRKALDSLTALQYDNKRKLICVICDGVAIGAGNDRPTPKIVLDILGVDPKVDPPALPFKSIGDGSDQLNYGKVYSGLYEFEGNVVPYIVVVKLGKESEQSRAKPGNRGKRDSQILLMSFLNRVHHRSSMNPLELEMFHQINNVIGVDPELYEYLLMVDADTCVREDSLNRLVAKCAGDAKIAGICGETTLQNEERSWWTMIQVYEYYISHNLAKAFESLFGSVTCLPGCFSMYRLRTADKGKPLIISDAVIREYSDGQVDTLHKKNLLSLGEDRYLTTLMTKHFPFMSYKFTPDAYCQTAAPEKWSVLLSQRRRWINSTVHNLQELLFLKELCGFCCFSMRFIVFIDLAGTIILPSTCFYIGYLIYNLATKTGPFPIITVAMLAAVYGLQALIFILKRQWQHIGWMIIYLLAFPYYSFVLPVYSFWNMDNFTWGNTRIVVGETGKKQIVAVSDEGFDPRSIPLRRWDDYALANNLPGRRGGAGQAEKSMHQYTDNAGYEMDDMKSVYSSVRQASILTGLQQQQRGMYAPPQSPARGPGMMSRTSTMQLAPPYSDNAPLHHRQSMVSMGGGPGPDIARMNSPYQSHTPRASTAMGYSGGARTPMGLGDAANHASQASFDFQRGNVGPDDLMIVEAIQGVLREVDLDTVTKKQVRALVEQRLQTQLVGERRTFMDRQIDSELANM